MRRFLVAFVVSLAAFGSSTASASWAPGSSGSGTATSLAVQAPTSVGATALTYSSVQVNWSAPTSGPTPTQYLVVRTAPTVATVCTVAPPTFTCTDTGLAASTAYSYTVTAQVGANWLSPASATASATTPAAPTLKLAATTSQTAGSAFTVTITATTNGVATDTTYTGTKTITFSGPANAPSGTAPTYPASVTFTAGVGTASVTLVKAETATLAATDGTRTGSVSITVAAGAAAKLDWSTSSLSCAAGSVTVGVGGAFTSKVTAYDTLLNPKTGARTVNLSRSPAQGTLSPTSLGILATASETTNSFTYTRSAASSTNVTVTAASTGLTSVACIVKQ